MATAMNTTVIVYKGVPLVKGGTGVLYLSGAAGRGALAGYAIKTYTNYYYTRENRGAIQVEDGVEALEGANYVSFDNASHGGKQYFGFIDHLIYISDGCTEIQFTVDPFPTFLEDCTRSKYTYVLRNTASIDTRGANTVDDFLPKTAGQRWNAGIASDYNFPCTTCIVYFIANQTVGSSFHITTPAGDSAIQIISNPTDAEIGDIRSQDGEILGAYLVPPTMAGAPAVYDRGTLSIHGSSLGTFRNNKVLTGVYHKVSLSSTQGRKYYEMEDFADPMNITFGILFFKFPNPSILVYPKNYQGIAENLAEGLTMQTPSIPVSVPAVYSQGQMVGDIVGIAGTALVGAAVGIATGGAGLVPIIAGAAGGLASGAVNMGTKALNAKFAPPSPTSSSTPNVTASYQLGITLSYVSPALDTLLAIDDYFDFYGYAVEDVLEDNEINENDGAFLQTGSVYLSGSEADDQLNARIMGGIKILKTL